MSTRPPSKQMSDLGERIEKYRLLKNITQADLAEDAGIGVRTLRRLEAGDGGTIDTLMRVLNALNISDELGEVVPDHQVRPIERVRQTKTERQRATTPRSQDRAKTQSNELQKRDGWQSSSRKLVTRRWGDGKK